MSYRVHLSRRTSRQINSWQLSDFVYVEVQIRLHQHLGDTPYSHLQPAADNLDGMLYRFSLIDPEYRLREHFFTFHVLYGQDEETLLVDYGW